MTLADGATFILIALVMFGLMGIGIPIFISIGLAAFAGLSLIFGPLHAMVDFTSFLWQSLNNFELVTIPLFVLTAMLVEEAKVGEELFTFAKAWVGSIPKRLSPYATRRGRRCATRTRCMRRWACWVSSRSTRWQPITAGASDCRRSPKRSVPHALR